MMPRRANTKPMRASSAARRTSIGSVIVAPTPTAGPLIAAITGFVDSKIRSVSSPPLSRLAPATLSRLRAVERVAAAAQVRARAEAPAGAGDDDRAHVVVRVREIERRAQLCAHLRGPRVQPLGSVQRDREHAVGGLRGDLLEVHGGRLIICRRRARRVSVA